MMETETPGSAVLGVSRVIREAMIANNADTLRSNIAEDYRGSDAGGRIHNRDLMLQAYGAGGVTLDEFEVVEVEARGWPGTVLLEGVATLSGHWQDQTFAHTLRFLDVYTLRDDRWLLIASQSTDIVE